ncbi:hypothetical protein TrRE_jg5329, partial [Triparma retinervis]
NYKRAEVLSRKYLGKKARRRKGRQGKESAKAFVESVDQKMNVLDKWLFGEDVKEKEEREEKKNRKQQQQQQEQDEEEGEHEGAGARALEEDDDPPVLFTLNMSDLRALISFIYGYHDLISTINLEYADESFGLVSEDKIWPYLAVAIDAYVEGEDGARRQMQNAAQNCLNTQLELGINAVDQVKNSVYFTHTPSDLWEMLNAHTHIAGIGEKNNERLQLKIIVAIAGIVNASVKQVVDDTLKNGKNMGRDGWKYICAVVNDCSQHVESLDSVLENIASPSVKDRLEGIFEKLSFSIYESAQRCCSLLISVVFEDLKTHVGQLFTESHDLATIACTIEDYNEDFKAGLQDFYFVKLQGSFLLHTITIYLTQLTKALNKGGDAKKHINVGSVEEDVTQLRECFMNNLKGPSLELPMKVIEDCVRLVCCEGDDIGIIAGEIANKRGTAFGNSVFECTRVITKMRADEFGVSKSQTRSNMLREVAEIVTRMAKEDKEGGPGEGEQGRDAQIYANAFPTSNMLEKGLESLKAGLGIGAGAKRVFEEEEEGGGIQEQLEIAEEETFDDSSAAKEHIDIEQVTRDSLMAKSSVGSKRRMTVIIKAGDKATLQAKGVGKTGKGGGAAEDSDMEGWLEKKSPSHNLWQPRYFKLIVNVKDKAKGGEFSWHKKEDAEKQNSIFLKDIVEPPKVLLSKRALVTHQSTRMVKLRNKEEDGPEWTDIDCKKDGEEYFEFAIAAKMKKKTREITLRSNDIDVMLSWVNGVTVLWMKFTGQWDLDGEVAEKGEDRGSANGLGSLGGISEEGGRGEDAVKKQEQEDEEDEDEDEEDEDEDEEDEDEDEEGDGASTKMVKGKRSTTLLRKDTHSSTAGGGVGGGNEEDQLLPLPCCVII